MCNLRNYKSALRMDGESVGDSSGTVSFDIGAGGLETDMNFWMVINDKHGEALVMTNLTSMWDFDEADTGSMQLAHDFLVKDLFEWDSLMDMEYANQSMTLELSNHNQTGAELFYGSLVAGHEGMTMSAGSGYVFCSDVVCALLAVPVEW
jgi:hypothetical protein